MRTCSAEDMCFKPSLIHPLFRLVTGNTGRISRNCADGRLTFPRSRTSNSQVSRTSGTLQIDHLDLHIIRINSSPIFTKPVLPSSTDPSLSNLLDSLLKYLNSILKFLRTTKLAPSFLGTYPKVELSAS